MNATHSDLRNRLLRNQLLRKRRERLGRTGALGPTVKALHDLATLMELSRLKIYRRGQQRTDYHLIMQSCYGPLMWWNRRTVQYQIAPLRTHRAERKAAEALMDAVVEVLGSEYGASVAEVRAVADRLASEALSRGVSSSTAA